MPDSPSRAAAFTSPNAHAEWLTRRAASFWRGFGEMQPRLLWPIYRLYERRLLQAVKAGPAPRHVGFILDGNRRYGRAHNLNCPHEIYALGADKLDDLIEWCLELGISAVTLWVLSTNNLKRSADNVSGILAALERKLGELAQASHAHQPGIRVRTIGRLDLLPGSTVAVLKAAEAATRLFDRMQLTIAAAYSGREEITDAFRSLLRHHLEHKYELHEVIDRVTPEAIARHLYSPDLPDPDLIVRTSGEIRLSGFLLWQSVSSEFYFADVHWPAFRKIDFLRAIRSFQNRHRRYGL